MHLTDVGYPDYTTDFASLTPPEQEFAGFIQSWWMTEGAFSMVNATKPQSAAYAFNDSPAGLAAWIMSMMSMLSTGEEIDRRFGRDELLTNIMIYWVTQTIGSSMRIAFETRVAMSNPVASGKSPVPAGVAHCPGDAQLPREWAERQTNLIHYSNLERGAHFVAWEAPEIWTKDFIEFTEVLNTYK
jgi:microsomal epoxide hydrolase